MGKRGPKPVDVERLKAEASNWAMFLFTLRDGQSGLIEKVRWAQWQAVRPPAGFSAKHGALAVMTPPRGRRKIRYRTSQILVAEIVPAPQGKKGMQELLSKLSPTLGKDWVFFRPTYPEPEIWEQLKRARSVRQVRQALHRIRKWWTAQHPAMLPVPTSSESDHPLQVATSYAGELLKAKRMPNYPRSDRPRSDDKRIGFFAKVLAGLMLEIAPATATKRLRHWHFPKDTAMKVHADFVERIKAQKGEKK